MPLLRSSSAGETVENMCRRSGLAENALAGRREFFCDAWIASEQKVTLAGALRSVNHSQHKIGPEHPLDVVELLPPGNPYGRHAVGQHQ